MVLGRGVALRSGLIPTTCMCAADALCSGVPAPGAPRARTSPGPPPPGPPPHPACAATLQLPAVMQVLLDRLRNEITRLTAVRAFGAMAASPLPVDMASGGVLEAVAAELTGFLRKALRPLRQAALATMQVRRVLECALCASRAVHCMCASAFSCHNLHLYGLYVCFFLGVGAGAHAWVCARLCAQVHLCVLLACHPFVWTQTPVLAHPPLPHTFVASTLHANWSPVRSPQRHARTPMHNLMPSPQVPCTQPPPL